MKELKIDVMGCIYKVLVGKADEIHIDKENMGECRTQGKKILVKTDKEDCNKRELEMRTQEILAHEIFHAYLNECGLELDSQVEEQLANFYMKNWRKMNNSVLECLDELGLLDIQKKLCYSNNRSKRTAILQLGMQSIEMQVLK